MTPIYTLFQSYVHKLTGEKIRIKKVYGGIVASCYITPREVNLTGKTMEIDTIVCSMENLVSVNELEGKQLKLEF